MKTSELKNLTDSELNQELDNLRKRQYRISEDMVVESSTDLKEFRQLKKDVARILTILNERKREEGGTEQKEDSGEEDARKKG